MKHWTCTQCGNVEVYGLTRSLSSEPEACSTCGNDAFEDPYVTGMLHKVANTIFG